MILVNSYFWFCYFYSTCLINCYLSHNKNEILYQNIYHFHLHVFHKFMPLINYLEKNVLLRAAILIWIFETKELLLFGTLLNRRPRNQKNKSCWSLKQMLSPKCRLPLPPCPPPPPPLYWEGSSFWEICFPQQKGAGGGHYKNTFTTFLINHLFFSQLNFSIWK